MEGLDPQQGKANYITGDRPEAWIRDVRMFGKVRARAIYPRIDLVYYGSELNLEYDFIISPGGDPRSIRLEFPEIGKLHLSRKGDLHLIGNGGSVIQRRPVAYQEIAGRRTEVAARYKLTNSGCVRFHVGEYDRTRPLVIDPVVSYATYLGGGRSDIAAALELDRSGNVYSPAIRSPLIF